MTEILPFMLGINYKAYPGINYIWICTPSNYGISNLRL